jgi:hypothetical protein
VVLARQWTGSRVAPLSPRDVLAQVAEVLRPYRVDRVYTDQYYVDALVDLASFSLVPTTLTERQRTEGYLRLRTRVADEQVELSPEPMLRSDLQRLKKRVTQGGLAVVLPKTSDGRHCDYAPALLLACLPYLDDVTPERPKAGTPEWYAAEEQKVREQWLREARRDSDEE